MLLASQGIALAGAILGILKSGKAYLPLDGRDPPDRVSLFVRESGSQCVVCDARHRSVARSVAPAGASILCLDEIPPEEGVRAPSIDVSPDQPAYIFYTSGTTGTPKGVVDCHRNVLHNVMRYTNALRISAEDRLSLVQAPHFSGAVSSMFCALLNGAALFPYDIQSRGLGERLAGWIVESQLTMFHSVPAIYRSALSSGTSFPTVRVVRLEGDAASVRDAELFAKRFGPGSVLANGIGATETGLIRQFLLRQGDPAPKGTLPIGYPVEDMEVVLLDDEGKESAPGERGEIVVISAYLADGYWRSPALTGAAFRTDPRDPSRRIYRTGDVGRMAPDGCLEYLGRKDSECKVRGHRIDPLEVESALLALPAVREAAVATLKAGAGEGKLIAYIVPTHEPPPLQAALRRALAGSLPEHMIPSRFVMIESLPLNANLKVDRRALPDPMTVPRHDAAPFRAPSGPLETPLAAIWETALGISPIGADDDFFDLGGDSLAAAEINAQIELMFGAGFTMATLFASPTVFALARTIGEGTRAAVANPVLLRQGGAGTPLVCIHGHQGHAHPFIELARHLTRPVVAFQSVGLSGAPGQGSTIPSIAARYIADLRRALPNGPYILAGFCFGGLIALEMARQLPRSDVAHLVMFDVTPHEFPSRVSRAALRRYRAAYRIRRLAFHREQVALLGRGRAWGYIARIAARWLRSHAERLASAVPLPARWVAADAGSIYTAAQRRYRPAPFEGQTTLFLSTKSVMRYAEDPRAVWDGVVSPKSSIVLIPCEEGEVLKASGVPVLAETLDSLAP